jgi:hypothetical protein
MSRNDTIRDLIVIALNSKESATPRSQQSREGILGPSDIGFCRQKAALVVRQVAPSDSVPKWSAAVGTAMHTYIEAALKDSHPEWLVGSQDHVETTATLPSGAVISGHPDVVVQASNAVLDIKTVDGFEWTRRNGPSLSHIYQRHLYALGLIQAEMFDSNRPVIVGNIYFDRSGKEQTPLVFTEEFDPALTGEIDQWVQDVIYAVKHNEDAARDVAAPVCERICEFFTICRGSLEVHDGQEIIRDETLLSAVDMYLAGRELESQGKQMKKEAGERLSNVTGMTATHQVRWVHVGPTSIAQTERAAHDRLDIRRRRKS